MKKIILLSLTILNSYWLLAQVCGTPHPINPVIYPDPDNANARSAGTSFCIDVFFHIVRNSNGRNAFTIPNTNDIVEKLNEFYNPHNIVINNAGTGFIDNTNFVNIDNDSEAATLGRTGNHFYAINYYIVENLWTTPRGYVTGTANSIPSNNLVIRKDRVLTPTSSHELGHCLNLFHTFETRNGIEAIARSNCRTAGDLVCDTPADQNNGPKYGYTPDLTNIMSGYRPRDHFSNGQGRRMRTAIASESVLSNIASCVRISSLNQLIYPDTETVRLSNVPTGVTVQWTTSNNVIITSRSNTHVSVRSKNTTSGYSTSQYAWIRATLSNGRELTAKFTVINPPRTSSITSLTSFGSVSLSTSRWTNITARYNGQISPGGLTWQWRVPNSYVRYGSSSNSYIHVKPNVPRNTSIYIRVRACNESGCSGWKGAWFNVTVPPPGRPSWGRPSSTSPNEIYY